MRPSKTEYFMGIAEAVSLRSHDSETKVGCILVKNKDQAVVATAFNGFVRDAPDDILPTTRPEKYQFITHCEENVISHCARHGISSLDTTLYITLSPCTQCIRQLYNAGITSIVYRDQYRDYQDLFFLPDLKVSQGADINSIFLSPRS